MSQLFIAAELKKQIEAEPEGPTKNLNPNALQAVKIYDINL